MEAFNIDVLCIQETRIAESSVKWDNGYMIILSGSDGPDKNWAKYASYQGGRGIRPNFAKSMAMLSINVILCKELIVIGIA